MSNTVEVDTRRECPTCGETFSHYPSQRKRRYCSKKCWYASKRQERQGVGELGRFLHDHWQKSGLSQRALGAQIQIDPSTLHDLMAGRTKLTQVTREKLIAAFGEAVPLPDEGMHKCPTCKKAFRDKPSHRRIYCSRACRAIKDGKSISPPTPFAWFLFDKWVNSDLTLSEWSRTVGIHRMTLQELMEGALPTQRTLDRLRGVYGDQLPETDTETERRRRVLAEHRGNPHTPEAKQKSGDSRRGQRHSPERVAKRLATAQASGGYERSVAALAATSRMPKRRVLSGLPMRLRATPQPSKDQLREWAAETGKKVGLSAEAVLQEWRPYLEKRGLWNAAGRPTSSQVRRMCRIVTPLFDNAPKGEDGDLAYGQWGGITETYNKATGENWQPDELGRRYRKHKKSCVCARVPPGQ